VQNYFNLETEVAHRRGEVERALAAAALHAPVRPQYGRPGWMQRALRTLASLGALATPRVPVPSWNAAGVKGATTLQGGGASSM
jgi:hypothetical protein